MTRPKQSQGFTLIELMITVVILGIFAAIAVPSFTSFINNNKVQSVSNELSSLLQYARSSAAQNNTPHIVCLSSGTWTVKRASLCSSTNDMRSMTSPANTTNPRLIICNGTDATSGYTLTVKNTGQVRVWNKGQTATGTALTSCTPS
jgi:type IV fimbrial biogenesis protein FimU